MTDSLLPLLLCCSITVWICCFCFEINPAVLLCSRLRVCLCWCLCVPGENSRVLCRSGHHGVRRHQCSCPGEAQEQKTNQWCSANQSCKHLRLLKLLCGAFSPPWNSFFNDRVSVVFVLCMCVPAGGAHVPVADLMLSHWSTFGGCNTPGNVNKEGWRLEPSKHGCNLQDLKYL